MSQAAPQVCFVTRSMSRQGGGVAEAVTQLALAVQRSMRCTVEIVTTSDSDLEQERGALQALKIRAPKYHGPNGFRFSPGQFWRIFLSEADVMHVHGLWSFHNLAVLLWHLRTGRPYIVSPHGMLEPWILNRSRALKRFVSWLYQSAMLRRAAVLHALAESEAEQMKAAAIDVDRAIIPNPVVPAPASNAPARWAHLVLGDRRIYLFFGRIHDKKGWRELSAAWRDICTQDQEFAARTQLVFCGWTDGVPEFEATVAQLAEEVGNVLYAGPQFGEEKYQSLRSADLLILPSKSEGVPMAVLEAWSCGKPVLMTRACNLAIGFGAGAALEMGEGVEDVRQGLLAIDQLSTLELADMGRRGRALVERDFSPASVAGKMSHLYIQLTGTR